VVHLRYPTRHRRRWRSTNLLERSLGEVKRRTKVLGRSPGEDSSLTPVCAVHDLYMTHATNGVRFTQRERQWLKRIRYEGDEPTTPGRRAPHSLSITGNLSRGEFTAAQGHDRLSDARPLLFERGSEGAVRTR